MADFVVDDKFCKNCGAEVRPNAAFCFNCGAQVVADEMIEIVNQREVSNAWFKETITEPTEEPKNKPVPKKIKKPKEPLVQPKLSDDTAVELAPLAVGETTLFEDRAQSTEEKKASSASTKAKSTKSAKSISAMRDKPKFSPKRKIEVTWERPNSAPNILFLTATIIFSIISLILIFTMLYIR